MNEHTLTTPNQANKPSFFCPCCGLPAKVDWQEWYVKPGGYWLTTCPQPKEDCVIGQATASVGSIENRIFLSDWKAPYLYELNTGEAVTAIDQYLANQIAWLVSQYTPEENAAFEHFVTEHHADDDFALMIDSFVSACTPAPDYSTVCDLHMEGR